MRNVEYNIISGVSELKNIVALVFFSIPGNEKLTFKYIKESTDTRTKEYHLIVPNYALKNPVTKRVEKYSPKNESYLSLIPSGEKLFSDITLDFKQSDPTYDIDDIGGIFPNSYKGSGLAVLQVLYSVNDISYMTNFFCTKFRIRW